MDQDTSDIFYRTNEELGVIKSRTGILLLGLTGGIASGKSTVARMLEEMGAPAIDFDLLAREVVAPGRPAWKGIVDYFGEEILRDDGSIDRKRLSAVVFHDREKRRVLEGLIHPRIDEEFVKKVDEIATSEAGAIIQAVIPLLIENGMQDLFDKIVLVHIPREKQIERLMARDRISKGEAIQILKAQMPLDDKIPWADFVIHNERSLEETKRQAEDLWKRLTTRTA